jgi:hypothetical protein
MRQAAERGMSPLDVEFRAVAALIVRANRQVELHVRRREHAALLVAEDLRHYLSAVRDQPAAELAAPPAWQLERLLSLTGTVTVRPVETDVYGTFVDVGVNIDPDGLPKPAAYSLIYDIPSNTWHDET